MAWYCPPKAEVTGSKSCRARQSFHHCGPNWAPSARICSLSETAIFQNGCFVISDLPDQLLSLWKDLVLCLIQQSPLDSSKSTRYDRRGLFDIVNGALPFVYGGVTSMLFFGLMGRECGSVEPYVAAVATLFCSLFYWSFAQYSADRVSIESGLRRS